MTKYLGISLVVIGTILLVGGYLSGTFVAHDGMSFGGYNFSVLLGFLFSGIWLHILLHKKDLPNDATKKAGIAGKVSCFLLSFLGVIFTFGTSILLNETGWGLDAYLANNGSAIFSILKTVFTLGIVIAACIFVIFYRTQRRRVINPKAYLYSFIAGFVAANAIHIVYQIIAATSDHSAEVAAAVAQ